ncbi:MAG TPA: histidine kinase dimerization/phosphoacceptor domain -containing protein [Phenylobacterium sp.]
METPTRATNSPADVLDAAVTGAQLPLVVADARSPDLPLIYANPAFVNLTGYEMNEVIGRNCRFLQGPLTETAAVDKLRTAIAERAAVSVEILNYRKNGSTFWNSLQISPVRNDAGEVIYFLGSQRDITAEREAANELGERNEALRRAMDDSARRAEANLEQKTVLLHEVDHRVKNNLQLISSLILLQSRRAEDEITRAALRRVLERVTAVATVHRRLFQGEAIDRFDFAEFVRDLAHDMAGASPRRDIEVQLALEPIEVGASQAAPLALILSELLTNALRHAYPEGQGGVVRIAVAPTHGGFELSVRDEGAGMTDETRAGHGFGLTIAHLLAQQLRAQIQVVNAGPGVGASVICPVSLAV